MRATRETWQGARDGRTLDAAQVRAVVEAASLRAGASVPDLVDGWDPRRSGELRQVVLAAIDQARDPRLTAWSRAAAGVPWWYSPAIGLDRERFPHDPPDLEQRMADNAAAASREGGP